MLSEELIPIADKLSFIQLLLKSVSPGVPDFYQGTELWNLSYVDPDNRRPVDFERRKKLLDEIHSVENCPEKLNVLLAERRNGAMKLFMTTKFLHVRRACPDLFIDGEFIPLNSSQNVISFLRKNNSQWLLIVAPLKESDEPIVLPEDAPNKWKNVLSGNEISFKRNSFSFVEVADAFPVLCMISV